MKKLLFVLCALFAVHISNATIYAIDVLKKGNKTVYLFSDVHIFAEQLAQQKEDVIKWAKQLDATLIVEDISDFESLKLDFCPKLPNKMRQAFSNFCDNCQDAHQEKGSHHMAREFLCLSHQARESNVSLINIELRQMIFWDWMPNGIQKRIINALMKDIKPSISKDDYKELEVFNKQLPIDKTIGTLTIDQKEALKSLTERLLDIRIHRAVYAAKADVVFVCAGAAHIKKVVERLVMEGWQLKQFTSSNFCSRFYYAYRNVRPSRLLGEEFEKNEVYRKSFIAAESISSPINIDAYFSEKYSLNPIQTGFIDLDDIVDEQSTANQSSWQKWAFGACGIAALGLVAYVAYKNNFGGWLKQKCSNLYNLMRYAVSPRRQRLSLR